MITVSGPTTAWWPSRFCCRRRGARVGLVRLVVWRRRARRAILCSSVGGFRTKPYHTCRKGVANHPDPELCEGGPQGRSQLFQKEPSTAPSAYAVDELRPSSKQSVLLQLAYRRSGA